MKYINFLFKEWRLVIILALAAWLRFDRLPELMPLIGDQGYEMLSALDSLENKELPLLGIPSNLPRFAQGPVFIWFLTLLFALFGPNPVAAGFMAAFLGLLAVAGIYYLALRWWGQTAALTAALILATAPLAVTQARLAFVTSPIPLVSLIYLWQLTKPWRHFKDTFIGFLLFGLLFQFELASFPLLILALYKLYLNRRLFTKINPVKPVIAGLSLGLLPQLLYDLTHGFRQLGLFMAWVGYRLAGFAGFDQEHRLSLGKIETVGTNFWFYLSRFFAWGYFPLATFFLILLTLGAILFLSSRKFKVSPPLVFSYLWIGILFLAYLVHGAPSEAYFPALFVPLALVLGWTVSHIKTPYRYLLILVIVSAAAINTHFLITHRYLIGSRSNLTKNLGLTYGPPLYAQQQAVDKAISQTGSRSVNLIGLGSGSEFDAFLNNFKFLFRARGIRLSSDGMPVFILSGPDAPIPNLTHIIYQFDSVTIALPYEGQ